MDKRLQEIQHGTLTESRLNSDFLFWLKTKGPNYLLAAMLVLCAFMGYYWWENRAALARDGAWNELLTSQTPQALIEVANKHSGTDAISDLATLNAADAYMESVASGKRFDREAAAPDATVTPELRTEYLAEADRLYAKVADANIAKKGAKSLIAATGLFGRAAVAETRNDPTQAALYLTQAHDLLDTHYPQLAKIAQTRKDSLPELSQIRAMPSRPAEQPSTLDPTASTQNLLAPTGMESTGIMSAPVVPPATPAAPK
ncbi:MAG: hypothetical protein K8R92_02220 [Planctomycetes bacterium]|nr:hypothetical protein [Planctomycetota bacterium]